MEAYCVKCKQKQRVDAAEPTFTKSGTPATKGVCSVCGGGVYRMGRTPAHEGLVAPEPTGERRRRKTKGKDGSGIKRDRKLVIVESPAKARTIGRFLGKQYEILASVGHVRDLLRSRLSVDVDDNFRPEYRVPNEKRKIVKELKAAVSQAEEVFLATDPDREGEAIAWHLLEAAGIEDGRARRVVFHEITKEAIDHAFEDPRRIDMNLVDAQQARRILDRLVGYNLSPLLWTKVRSRLSAGRVQSAALRMIVDRERAIEKFSPEEYWTIEAELLQPEKPPSFRASMVKIDGETPKLTAEGDVIPILEDLRSAGYRVERVRRATRVRKPKAPFTTSSLQQDASSRLSLTPRQTMIGAQQLYEGIELGAGEPVGLITYMRTDSTQISAQAKREARQVIRERYGEEYLPEKPPEYRKRGRRAQEAHEAIRPTSVARTPESVEPYLDKRQFKLYSLIWQRFLASQMKPAEYDTLTVNVEGKSTDRTYGLRVAASSLRFPGYLEVYDEAKRRQRNDDGAKDKELQMAQLPDLAVGDALQLVDVFPDQHFTQPPGRYSEAGLVKALEEHGIGRPSTYAPILTTLKRRNYVEVEKRRMRPTEIGEVVNDLIVEHFPDVVDLGFTAKMEAELDGVAAGNRGWVELIREFYVPFSEQLERARIAMPEVKIEPETLDRLCPECGNPLVLRQGRFGKFIGCSTFPTCRHTEPWLEKIGVHCPLDGADLVERRTRKGRVFYGCANYPECEFTSWKRPLAQACTFCGGLLVRDSRKQASCTACGEKSVIEEISEGAGSVA